jgi:N utilization substance protein B
MQRKPRQFARELALLVLGQLSKRQLTAEQPIEFQELMSAAVRSLVSEAQDVLETAATELSQGNDRLRESQFKPATLNGARTMVQEAIELSEKAINRIGMALELPELIQMAHMQEVRAYAISITQRVIVERDHLDQLLNGAMVDWQLNRLPRIDQDILRIAAAEILYLDTPHQVAISEAVELTKQYSDEESRRLLNGILRRVVRSLELTSPGPSVKKI